MQPIATNLQNSEYTNVFMGTVTRVDESDLPNGPTYTIEVGNTYRGDVDGTITVSTAGHSCGSFYAEGVSMIWFMGDDVTYVDEVNPQYRVNSRTEADAQIEAAQGLGTVEPTRGAPSTCRVWFDGCNTCSRDSIDGQYACTEMACGVYQEAECQTYFTAEEGAPFVAGPTGNPEDDFVGPTAGPPVDDEEAETPGRSWWQRAWDWIRGLFN